MGCDDWCGCINYVNNEVSWCGGISVRIRGIAGDCGITESKESAGSWCAGGDTRAINCIRSRRVGVGRYCTCSRRCFNGFVQMTIDHWSSSIYDVNNEGDEDGYISM